MKANAGADRWRLGYHPERGLSPECGGMQTAASRGAAHKTSKGVHSGDSLGLCLRPK